MSRRKLICLVVTSGILAAAGQTLAQADATLPIVGFVALASSDPTQTDAIAKGLRENGHVLGRSVRLEARFGNGDREHSRRDIDELLAMGTRVFVAAGPNVARMIQTRSKDAAIVVASLEVLESAGVTGTIPRPAGNVTGFATLAGDLIAKRVELLREIMPGLRNLAVVVNPANRMNPHLLRAFLESSNRHALTATTVEIGSPQAIEAALAKAKASGADAAIFFRDYLFDSNRQAIVEAALAAGLACSFDEAAFVHQGGLMSYSPNRPDLFRRSAAYIAKILAGSHPRDLPIQQPTKFELVVNLKTAKALGLTIPPSILIRADEVIE